MCLALREVSLEVEVLQCFVVGVDVDVSAQQVNPPFSDGSHDGEHFLFMYRVILFHTVELSTLKCNRLHHFPCFSE